MTLVMGFPQVPEAPTGGVFDIRFDPRIFDGLMQTVGPAVSKVIINTTLQKLESLKYNAKSIALAQVYPHRREDY